MFDQKGRPEIPNTRWEGGEAVSDYVRGSGSYFSRADIIEEINAKAAETLAWMRENNQSYSETGDLRYEPWWPNPPATNSLVLKLAGERVLIDRAYEHGILHLLRCLEVAGIIHKLNQRVIDLVIDAMTPVVMNQLVIHRHATGLSDGVSLKQLSALFGNGKNTKPGKIRDRYLGDLASIGLFKARECEGWDISLGPVSDAFYTQVFTPIMNETCIEYKEQ